MIYIFILKEKLAVLNLPKLGRKKITQRMMFLILEIDNRGSSY
jgi:hypothetical protein